jgi:ribosome-associated toxin RatA of RatAB toxin-antitoxin module
MKMQRLNVNTLKSIAQLHTIEYEPLVSKDSKKGVATRMSRVFPVPQSVMYDLMADIKGHHRFLPILRKIHVITNEDLGGVLGKNQVLAVESLEEGGSKVGVKAFTFTPPKRVEVVFVTDPFGNLNGGNEPLHNKNGRIVYATDKVSNTSSRLTSESDFVPNNKQFYVRGLIDHVWVTFFENLMIHHGELKEVDRKTRLFG